MKRTKRVISLFLVLALSFAMLIPASAADSTEAHTKAAALKQLSLFKGVTDTNFDLGRAPTRTEALVMLIRTLGKESEALDGTWPHPFKDVEPWADKYVGYALSKGLTKGSSATEFGSGDAGSDTYLTFVLRALGYDDSKGDFVWDDPYKLAKSVGILPSGVDVSNFLRGDVVLVSWASLKANIKGTTKTLSDKLIEAGVFTAARYKSARKFTGEIPLAVPADTYEIKEKVAYVKSIEELKGALASDKVSQIELTEGFDFDEDLTITKPLLIVEKTVSNIAVLTVKSELTLGGVNFENTRIITVANGGTFNDYMSTIENRGQFTVEAGAKLQIDRGGIFNNSGNLKNSGTITITDNGGNMYNTRRGIIENNSVINCSGYYKNEGTYMGTGKEPVGKKD